MRIPLTGYAIREIVIFGGLGLVATAAVVVLAGPFWWAALLPAIITGWVFSFFRDPERRIPQGERLLISPADGTVTNIETIDAPEELGTGGQALRISIFLSVFSCHINRAPCAGRVERIVYKPGRYLDARHRDSAKVNEQNILILYAEVVNQPILVRQVSGAIARRIVCAAKVGDRLDGGQRFGMIKFGSRTELVVPVAAPVDVRLKVGDKIKAGLTIVGEFTRGVK